MIKIQTTLTRKKQLPAGAKQCSTKTASANSRLSKRTHAPSPNSKTNQKPQSAPLVPGEGVEPSLPCRNQILSLTRLPIPPSGHKQKQLYAKQLPNYQTSFFHQKDDKIHAIKTRFRTKPYPFPSRPFHACSFTSFTNGSRLKYA